MASLNDHRKKLDEARKRMQRAAKEDVVSIEIGDEVFDIDVNIFALEDQNLGILNEQISDIPAYIAYVGKVYAAAEKFAARKVAEFNLWKAQKTAAQEGKSELAKENMAMVMNSKAWAEFDRQVEEANYMTRLLKTYSEAIKSKWELAQTLSANIRRESEGYGRNAGERGSNREPAKAGHGSL